MRNLSLQEKEENFISTLLYCNNLFEQSYESKLTYHKNMINLFESISGNNFDNKINESLINYDNYRNNKLSFFKDVNKLFEDTDIGIIANLNENIKTFNNDFNIFDFKNDLHKHIEKLSKQNDFDKLDKLPSTVLKIKLFMKSNICVNGFDILNNLALQKELTSNFGLNISNLISIIFDKSNKQLLFIFNGEVITYILENNVFDKYINCYNDDFNKNVSKINQDNYLELIKNDVNTNIIELHKNLSISEKYKFEENLYFDNKKTKENKETFMYRKSNLFFKS